MGYLALFFLVAAESPSLHQESARPHQPKKAQAMATHNGTPVPPRYLIRGPGVALSPDVFARDKGTPVPLSHHYVGVASSSNPVHPQQSLLAQTNYGNPSFPSVNPPGAPFLPGFYSSGEHGISQLVRNRCCITSLKFNNNLLSLLKFTSAASRTFWHHTLQVVGFW